VAVTDKVAGVTPEVALELKPVAVLLRRRRRSKSKW
jgi:hypothetical protein